MMSKIQKWGNSLALRLPKALASELDLQQGSTVEVRQDGGKLVIEPQREPEYKLSELLKGVNKRNLHGETKDGGPIGRETI